MIITLLPTSGNDSSHGARAYSDKSNKFLFMKIRRNLFRNEVSKKRIFRLEAQKLSEYDQEMPQSHTADQPTAL